MTTMSIRSMFAKALGAAFGGKRDLYELFGYSTVITHEMYLQAYKRQDIARRVIDAPINATWTDFPMMSLSDDAETIGVEGGNNGTGSNQAWTEWNDIVREHNVYKALKKLDTFVGLGQFAILLIGLDDGKDLSTPVSQAHADRRTPRKVIYLQPYLEGSVKITEYDSDKNSSRFCQPTMYEINPGKLDSLIMNPQNRGTTSAFDARLLDRSFKVHWTRVLHVADNTMESGIFGASRLEPVYNTLCDLLKVAGGTAETFWLTSNRGMQVDVDKDMEMSIEDEQNLADEIDEYEHELRRMVRTRGVKINPLGTNVADPKGAFSVLVQLLAAATGIPQRILTGAEAGQLASNQDRANWAIMVSERIIGFAEPSILKPFIKALERLGVLAVPDNLTITWPDPFKMSPPERAATSAQMARSAVNIVRAMQQSQEMGQPVLSIEEARAIIGPGKLIPVLNGTPKGTLPPKQSQKMELEEDAAELAEKNAETAEEMAKQQNGGDPSEEDGLNAKKSEDKKQGTPKR